MFHALETFLDVAAAGSFSEVARKQAVAVSSITRKIDVLEDELGVRLFTRSSRRLTLTDAGELFVQRARHILDEVASAKDALHADDAEPRGLLTLTAPTVFGRLHVVPAVASFLRRYPEMEVDLHLTDAIVDLNEQRMDLAIRIGMLPDSDLHATKLAQVRLVTCASPAYLERAGLPLHPEDLLRHECITRATGPEQSFLWSYPGVHRSQPLPVRGRYRADNKDAQLAAAMAGLGVLHIATWLVATQLRSRELIALFPEEAHAPVPDGVPAIHAVRLPGRSHAVKSRLFIEHLKASIGETPWWDAMLAPSVSGTLHAQMLDNPDKAHSEEAPVMG